MAISDPPRRAPDVITSTGSLTNTATTPSDLDRAFELIHELRNQIESLNSQIQSLEHELTEANAEIGHHHEDFRAISRIVRG